MKNKPTQFSVRVYGCALKEGKVLFLREHYHGKEFLKFPGGGVEFGEGLKESLLREWKEELNLDIKIKEHLYTQDFFQESMFDPNDHLLIVYYIVKILNISELYISDDRIREVKWISLDENNLSLLPIDEVAFKILQKKRVFE